MDSWQIFDTYFGTLVRVVELWDNNDKFHTPCFVCLDDIFDNVYTSRYYPNFGIHASCASIPERIDHPFHPEHPLILHPKPPYDSGTCMCHACGRISWAITYHCEMCNFDLDVHGASILKLDKRKIQEEENQIRQLSHPHPLILCKMDLYSYVPCSGCKQLFTRFHMYACLHCHCLLDKSCAEWPSQIKHPFHLQHPLTLLVRPSTDLSRCSTCGNSAKGFAYHCSECKFNVDLSCASLMPREIQVQHLKHPHPLILCRRNKKNFNAVCFGCKQPFGKRRIYVCLYCNCLLDESCARCPEQIKHPFHPKHPLTQLIKPDYNSSRCRACGNRLKGLTFHCFECQFGLHVWCAYLMPSPNNQDQELQFQQLGHPHPLVLSKKNFSFHFTCYACHLLLKDSVYVCIEYSILLHKSCANLPRKIHCSHYHKHSLTLVEHSPPRVEECLETKQLVWQPEMYPFHPEYDPNIIAKNAADHKPEEKVNVSKSHFQRNASETNTKGFTYVCGECAVWFDVRSIQCQLHEHPLTFFNIIFNQLSCGICHRSLHTPPFFRCEKCNFNLHVSCVPILPQMSKVARHRHNLSLTKSPVKERPEDDENSEFYCDVCEQSRELSDPTYKCEECKFVAHVHCTVTKELHVLVEEWSLPFKLENTKSDMSSSVHEGIGGKGVLQQTMIAARGVSLVAECKAKGARFAGDHASLIELDAEIADHLGKKMCLETEFTAILNRKYELQRRLEELKERRDSSDFRHLLVK